MTVYSDLESELPVQPPYQYPINVSVYSRHVLRSDGLRSACFITDRGIGDADDDGHGIEVPAENMGEGASIDPLEVVQFE